MRIIWGRSLQLIPLCKVSLLSVQQKKCYTRHQLCRRLKNWREKAFHANEALTSFPTKGFPELPNEAHPYSYHVKMASFFLRRGNMVYFERVSHVGQRKWKGKTNHRILQNSKYPMILLTEVCMLGITSGIACPTWLLNLESTTVNTDSSVSRFKIFRCFHLCVWDPLTFDRVMPLVVFSWPLNSDSLSFRPSQACKPWLFFLSCLNARYSTVTLR